MCSGTAQREFFSYKQILLLVLSMLCHVSECNAEPKEMLELHEILRTL
jgi:hypothetical protein